MKKIFKIMSNRVFVVAVALVLQLFWFVGLGVFLTDRYIYFNIVITAIAIVTSLWLVNQRINPSYKLTWAIVILGMPILGIVLYFIMGKSRIAKKFCVKYEDVLAEQGEILREDEEYRTALAKIDRLVSGQSVYLRDYADSPVYQNTKTEYFPVGEDWFAKYLEELDKAEHYIFMEYFILGEGYMWNAVLEILTRKAAEGVDVRLIYDDFGCIISMPPRFYKSLQAKGIKCASFNPVRPLLNIVLNNRDHRKITVIDGHTAFTGGVNLSDEYINQKVRFGHWKDSGIYLHGEAVWNFTVMFLRMWSVITGMRENFENFKPKKHHLETFETDGFVQPYGDNPMDNETVGENVYLNIISRAKDYVYIFTPYLVADHETMQALCTCAKRGVDVRIVTPGIPDKKIVFLTTQSYYEELIESGVRIYQYTPGFIHSKSFVSDDDISVVGTINLDYRSLYLHFECGVWMYQTESIADVKDDFLKTLEYSEEMTLDFCRNRNLIIRGFQSILRLIAPML